MFNSMTIFIQYNSFFLKNIWLKSKTQNVTTTQKMDSDTDKKRTEILQYQKREKPIQFRTVLFFILIVN